MITIGKLQWKNKVTYDIVIYIIFITIYLLDTRCIFFWFILVYLIGHNMLQKVKKRYEKKTNKI